MWWNVESLEEATRLAQKATVTSSVESVAEQARRTVKRNKKYATSTDTKDADGNFVLCIGISCGVCLILLQSDNFFLSSVLWHYWLGDMKGIRIVKSWVLVVMIWLELCMSYSSSCHHHFHNLCINKHRLIQVHLVNMPLKRRERKSDSVLCHHV